MKCPHCNNEEELEIKDKMGYCPECTKHHELWINVYEVTRHYGGPEEGGWWYNREECIFSDKIHKGEDPDRTKRKVESEYEDLKEGNIYSVLGGTEIYVKIESEKAETEDIIIPHYE